MLEKYEICCGLFHGFDWSRWIDRRRRTSGSSLLPAAQEHILAQEDGKDRLLQAVTELSQAFALAVPHDEALAHPRRRRLLPGRAGGARQERTPASGETDEELDHAIRQIVSRAVASDEVIDIFAAAGLEEAGHLDPVRRVPGRGPRPAAAEPRRRAAAEAARTARSRRASRRTSCRRGRSPRCWSRRMRRYQNRAIETAQVIEELIAAGQGDARGARSAAKQLGLTDDELAFYDALEANDSAVKVLGDETLRDHRPRAGRDGAQERHDRLDGARERAGQAARLVKRILRKHGYPPDKQEKATQTVLEQAEVLSRRLGIVKAALATYLPHTSLAWDTHLARLVS